MKRVRRQEPCVGIFWLYDGTLLLDRSPLSEADPYGNHLTHPRSHNDVWETWKGIDKVPAEVGYEEPPRGRVMFDRTSKTFTLLGDRCILRRKDVIAKIRTELNLPKGTKLGADSHYRCYKCLYPPYDEA